jgi:hypothetical protein
MNSRSAWSRNRNRLALRQVRELRAEVLTLTLTFEYLDLKAQFVDLFDDLQSRIEARIKRAHSEPVNTNPSKP